MPKTKRVYTFGNKQAEGNGKMRELLGGKGANLAEMNLIGIPVPPGFTITTEVCAEYYTLGKEGVVKLIKPEVEAAMKGVEQIMNMKFGDSANPLLVSVRSGARASMPGMMDTILNLGLNDEVVEGLAKKMNNPRFAWDSYRRFVQMYGDVVMDMKPQSKEDEDPFEEIIDAVKKEKGVKLDTDLTTDDLKELVKRFKAAVKKVTGKDFPTDPWEQLWGAVCAVFSSWMNERAILYRKLNNIPAEWGTAVNVQSMVFGNMGETSATGVAFTRDAATGEDIFNGEYLVNAQGEDVVAGIRTPQEITIEGSRRWAELQGISESERATKYPSLEEVMPAAFTELNEIQQHLEEYFKDMQDIEFTIQSGKLWMLQTRSGKRTGAAMVKIAMDMLAEGMIDAKTAVLRVEPAKLDELLHPVFDSAALKKAIIISKGLPASPGAATGQIVFFADDAEKWAAEGKKTILVRIETSPEDLKGMTLSEGILTARGGMTSHAAVVARGMGKCCVSGAGDLVIDYKNRTITVGTKTYKEGDWISLNGSTGVIYEGKVATKDAEVSGDFAKLMELADEFAHLKVRANADTPRDAKTAFRFGAQGIGLCRTEHMFFEGDRIKAVREMILADDEEGRRKALAKLLPMQRGDFEGLFETMNGHPVTVRLLDPPLHEFVPHFEKEMRDMAAEMKVSYEVIKNKVDALAESNPMLGHRGCRLGNTYPEITEMQTRAIIEAALNIKKKGIDVHVEIMVPLVGTHRELRAQKAVIDAVAQEVFAEHNMIIDYAVGTMIEIPRAAVTANQIAEVADFFSFGTNDLTQMTFGYSRDDVAKFLPIYLEKGILKYDPFQIIDVNGVGQLVREAVFKGRSVKPQLKCGICGEHGGEPTSVEFCHYAGLNYVSCSPYRVPIARLAAAHAALKQQ
ncbi:pyruvate, phosphate dikinase [Alistipes indistinctus]|jgi:pyruvate,orthophosphate dikinase|uniref:Pyruvate, phosphate dikinase n=5 Tax=Alistipes indistinctus TaxID=626932 RepID=G5H6C8_9BACT|nr:pyruvate, phosphate dikinase [Alistipes indistinctus]MBS1438567.1 pyruvate, phosphate dikinase [Alistipes sp.]EHB93222.1 pyruvate, phosphate dikinase [Alistipes indistinctus YIT 12060]KAA3143735.1 pyruvate, phosphate dikinase [Alistipes indistinctus]MBD9134220.1 pyruvate, phosphate dikinase [Alistipes indistinctus]MBD9134980.1 pyruvate, phosphate dikinase [Alistipes indistinctus]